MSEVEKAIKPLSASECNAWNNHLATDWKLDEERVETFVFGHRAGRAEAIASTEAKFRELANAWRADATLLHYLQQYGQGFGYARTLCANQIDSLLTPCPQSRHDAGESESK